MRYPTTSEPATYHEYLVATREGVVISARCATRKEAFEYAKNSSRDGSLVVLERSVTVTPWSEITPE